MMAEFSSAELLRIIDAKCRDCSGSKRQAKDCTVRGCPLWPVLHRDRTRRAERRTEGVQLGIRIPRDAVIRIEVEQL